VITVTWIVFKQYQGGWILAYHTPLHNVVYFCSNLFR